MASKKPPKAAPPAAGGPAPPPRGDRAGLIIKSLVVLAIAALFGLLVFGTPYFSSILSFRGPVHTDTRDETYGACVERVLTQKKIFTADKSAQIAKAFDILDTFGLHDKSTAEVVQQVIDKEVAMDAIRGCAGQAHILPDQGIITAVNAGTQQPLDGVTVSVGSDFERCSTTFDHSGKCRVIVAPQTLGAIHFMATKPRYRILAEDVSRTFTVSDLHAGITLHLSALGRPTTILVKKGAINWPHARVRLQGQDIAVSRECEDEGTDLTQDRCQNAETDGDGYAGFYFFDATGHPMATPSNPIATITVDNSARTCRVGDDGSVEWNSCGERVAGVTPIGPSSPCATLQREFRESGGRPAKPCTVQNYVLRADLQRCSHQLELLGKLIAANCEP